MTKNLSYFHLIIGLLFTANLFSQTLHLSAIGANENETKVIDSIQYQNQFKDFVSLSEEVKNLQSKLQTSGYFESQLIELHKQNDSSYIANFSLKERYTSIRIYHGNTIDKKLLHLVSDVVNDNYFQVQIISLEATLKRLNAQIANQGDPFSTLQLVNVKKESDGTLSAELGITNTSQRQINNVIVKGYDKFPKSYVSRFLKIKTGQVFNLKTIKEKTQKLDELLFANQIKDPEVLFTKDSTLLYIYVEKTKSNIFDGFLGFGTNTETNKIEFDGYLNLNLTNNLNYGESLKLYYKSDENEQKTFDLNAKLPYIFRSPLSVELKLNIFKKDSSFVTVSQTAKLGYQFDSKNQISIGISVQRTPIIYWIRI